MLHQSLSNDSSSLGCLPTFLRGVVYLMKNTLKDSFHGNENNNYFHNVFELFKDIIMSKACNLVLVMSRNFQNEVKW